MPRGKWWWNGDINNRVSEKCKFYLKQMQSKCKTKYKVGSSRFTDVSEKDDQKCEVRMVKTS